MEERPEQLQKRFLELAERAYQNGTYVFTPFLGIQEQSVFYKMEKMLPPVPWEASGGMNGCERRMVRFGSEGLCGYEQPFPIACIAVQHASSPHESSERTSPNSPAAAMASTRASMCR